MSDTYRDRKDVIKIYHVSQERLGAFSGKSKMNGKSGVFFSPSYKSLIEDWMPYVKNKKQRQHPLQIQWSKTWDTISDLENKEDKTEEDVVQISRLKDKVEKLRISFDSEKHRDEIDKGYKKVYIHEVACPKDIFKKSNDFMNRSYDEGYLGGNLGFWGWGEQVFIVEEDLPRLKVLGVKELNTGQYLDEYDKSVKRRYIQ